MAKAKKLHIYYSAETRKKLEALSAANHRTMSGEVCALIDAAYDTLAQKTKLLKG